MSDPTEDSLIARVQQLNRRYPSNKNYSVTGEQKVGPYTIYSVEFTDDSGSQNYTNFCVAKGVNILSAHYYLEDVMRYVDRGMGWRSLFVDQFTVVIGSVIVFLLTIELIHRLFVYGQADQSLWVTVSTGIGYLFGAKSAQKLSNGN